MLCVPLRVAFCVAALLATPAVVLAKDVRTIHQKIVYYDVSGDTLAAISAEMRTKTPPAANGYSSLTTFYYSWYFSFWNAPDASGAMACTVNGPSVVIDIEILLPRHPGIADTPPEVQQSWNSFIAAAEKHELRHAADFAEIGFGLFDAIAAVSAPDCTAAQAQITAITEDFVARANKAGVDYDVETNHGINDGALLR